ncbi:MAG: LPS-assembly protein LptD [Alphaproteobacteria bacterium]|nr:LPS-assembly protein LptD [Alphaproteobacteria bacterium]
MMFHRVLRILALLILGLGFITPSFAAETDISFEADSVIINEEDGSLFATGNVIMKQAGMTLSADEVRYNKTEGRAVAKGNVVFVEADGATHKSDVMTLDSEFTHIVAETLRSRYPDGSFFTAKDGDIKTKSVSIFDGSRFSACNCDFENGETPIWDLRATSTRHNVETKTIIHRNVRMHIMNLPVGYLPYLAHPDWTVRRRSGFLTPTFLINSDLGFTASIPYFQVIDDTRDVEFTPFLYQRRGKALRTRYRQNWDDSELNMSLYTASVETFKKNRESVAAIDAGYGARIGNGWDVKARFRRASQDTFMRRYKFNGDTKLQSDVVAERLKQDRYYRVEMSDIQGLNAADTPDREPTILPHVVYEKVAPGMRSGQRIRTEISAIQVDNDEGHNMSRWTGNLELHDEIRTGRVVTDLKAGAIGTYYSIQKKPSDATTKTDDLGRITPQVSAGWRLPIAVTSNSRSAIVEPRLQFVHVGGPDMTDDIPNRDSADYRIDEGNLFLLNRYQGYDYLRPGSRADMGVSAVAQDAVLGEVSGFIGASYRISGKATKGLAVNERDAVSDIVASLSVNPDLPIAVSWAGRMASSDLTLNESRTNIAGTYGKLGYAVEHQQLAKSYFTSAASNLEELKLTLSYDLPKGWTAKGTQVWDLSNGRRKRDSATAALQWTGGIQDCLTFNLDYDRDVESDRDISASDQFMLTINFKYLGSITQKDIWKTKSP